MKSRLTYLDFGAGIMILWMVIFHILGTIWSFDLNGYWEVSDLSLLPEGTKAIINSAGKVECLNPCVLFPYLNFFMPWFFYKSGQFFKQQRISILWQRDWQKLFKPFLLWSVIGYIMYILFGWLNNSITLYSATFAIIKGAIATGSIPVNGPLWFLSTLFIVRFFANIVLPKQTEKCFWLKIIGIILAGYIVAFLTYKFDYRFVPLWVGNGVAGLIFFCLGYAFSKYEKYWWVIIPCCIVYVICCFSEFPIVDMKYNKLCGGDYLLWIPISYCSIVSFNAICKILYKYIRIKPIELIGQYAMPIFVTHVLFIASVKFFITYFDITISSTMLLYVILLTLVIFLPITCKFFDSKIYQSIINSKYFFYNKINS